MRIFFIAFTVLICETSLSQNIYTIAGTGTSGFSGDGGAAINAKISNASAVVVNQFGDTYFTDFNNNRVRLITSSGTMSTVAGNGTAGYSGDGGQAISAQLNGPCGLALDQSGNLFISEYYNNCIRKVITTGVISTICGTMTVNGNSGDGGPAQAALLNRPTGLAVDDLDNIYIADYNNNRVRVISTSGFIYAFAGTGTPGYAGDGGLALNAQLKNPESVSCDGLGNVYIADYNNSCIRKVATNGTITTIAGTGISGYSGDGGPANIAQLKNPHTVCFAPSGNIYISDLGDSRIRRINNAGVITTIAGNGINGFSGDGGLATLARLNNVYGVAEDSNGNIVIGDGFNYRIRLVCNNLCASGIETKERNNFILVFPNPVLNNLNIKIENFNSEDCEVQIVNYLGQGQLRIPFTNSINVSNLAPGFYYLRITSQSKEIYSTKFIKE